MHDQVLADADSGLLDVFNEALVAWTHVAEGRSPDPTAGIIKEDVAKGCAQMSFADPGRPEREDIGAGIKPAIAFGKRGDPGVGDHRDRCAAGDIERLAHRQTRFGETPSGSAVGGLGG